jgi:hypothetical protein
MTVNRSRMAHLHETRTGELFNAFATRGSGNQPGSQTDRRTARDGRSFPVAIECKSTLARSFSVTREIWDKLRRQSHLNRSILAVCLYENTDLTRFLDLTVLDANDAAELVEKSEQADQISRWCALVRDGEIAYSDRDGETAAERLAADVERLLVGRRAVNADLPVGFEETA